jgi:hypothetical protein
MAARLRGPSPYAPDPIFDAGQEVASTRIGWWIEIAFGSTRASKCSRSGVALEAPARSRDDLLDLLNDPAPQRSPAKSRPIAVVALA